MVYSLLSASLIAEGVQTRSLPAWKEIFVNNREEKLFLLFSFAASNPLRLRLFWNRKLFWLEDSDLCLFVFIFTNVISCIVAFDNCQLSYN